MIGKSRHLLGCYVIIVLLAIGVIVSNQESEFSTSSFCAYNIVFVEFQEGNRKWGTILLDKNGKPLACSETDLGAFKMQNLDLGI